MPKQIDHDAQRRLISQAALSVIGREGMEAARLRDVAAEAGLTTGAVTHYFDGKDAVLEAALAEIVREMLEDHDGSWESPPQDLEGLITALAGFLPLDDEDRKAWRIWLAFWGRAIVEERLRAKHQHYYGAIAGQLARAIRAAAPTLKPQAARELSDAIIAAIDGIGVRATLEPEAWPAKRQRATLQLLLEPLLRTAFPLT